MVSGEQGAGAHLLESICNDRASRLLGEAAPPALGPEMKSELVNPLIDPIRPQAGTTGVRAVFKNEDGPVLNVISVRAGDFSVQPLLHLLGREWTSNQRGYFGISPKPLGQRQIARRPMAESQTPGSQEVLTSRAAVDTHVDP